MKQSISRIVDGKRVTTIEDIPTDELSLPPSIDPNDYPLNGVKFRELLFDGTREDELKSLLAGLGASAKGKARAYIEGSQVFNWSDQYVKALANKLSEGEAAFKEAWTAKGQE